MASMETQKQPVCFLYLIDLKLGILTFEKSFEFLRNDV